MWKKRKYQKANLYDIPEDVLTTYSWIHSTDILSAFSKRIDLMGLMGMGTRHRNLGRGDTWD